MTVHSETNVMAAVANSPHAFLFMCPGCHKAHSIRTDPAKSPCWQFNGDMVKPTIRASVLVYEHRNDSGYHQPRCHSFVTDGQIKFLGDCTHDLKGQTVPLPVFGWDIYDDDETL